MATDIAGKDDNKSDGTSTAISLPSDERIPVKTSSGPKHEALPNELLANIFKYLETRRLALSRVHDQPNFEITDSDVKDLKNVAQVSKRWRSVALPKLFRHARFMAKADGPGGLNISEHMNPFFELVKERKLGSEISSFTLLVRNTGDTDDIEGSEELVAKFWEVFFQTFNPLDLLIVAPPVILGALTACYVPMKDAQHFHCPYHYLQLQQPVLPGDSNGQEGGGKAPEKAVVDAQKDEVDSEVKERDIDSSGTKDQAAQITASTSSTEATAARATPEVDDISNQLSSSSVVPEIPKEAPKTEPSSDRPPNPQSTLFSIRPWTVLLLNEGSFIKALCPQSPTECVTPSILRNLLGSPPSHLPALMPPTIRTLSYIAIFPLLAHFTALTTSYPPRLHSLYVQMAPRNAITSDPAQMFDVDESDLWMERNSAYAAVMRDVMEYPVGKDALRNLKRFESGDCADKDAWGMAVEYVRRANMGRPEGDRWVAVRDGVFARGGKEV